MMESADGTELPQQCRPVCGERTELPAHLVPLVLALGTPGAVTTADVERALRCTLEDHAVSDHYAMVMELGSHAAVWTRWIRGRPPAAVLVLLDCPGADPSAADGGPCSEFAGHSGGHSNSLADPWAVLHQPPSG